MENIQVLRYMASLEARIKALDPNNQSIDLSEVNNRLSNLEQRPTVDLSEINNRLSNLEARPDVMQRLSALELTVASLNSS